MSLTVKNTVFHGTEAAAFVGFANLAGINLTTSATAYGSGKLTYLWIKNFLYQAAPEVSTDTKKILNLAVSALVGGTTLYFMHNKSKLYPMDTLNAAGTTVAITAASLIARTIAVEGFKALATA